MHPCPATQKDDIEKPWTRHRRRVAHFDVGTSHAHHVRVPRISHCAKEMAKWKDTPPVPGQFKTLKCLRGSEALNRATSAIKNHSALLRGPVRKPIETVPTQMCSQLPVSGGGLCGPSRKPVETVRMQMESNSPFKMWERRVPLRESITVSLKRNGFQRHSE